jgi:hypothetical protein
MSSFTGGGYWVKFRHTAISIFFPQGPPARHRAFSFGAPNVGNANPSELTARERKFLVLYPECGFNAAAAIRRVFPRRPFASDVSARVAGCQMLARIRKKLGPEYWDALGLSDEEIARVYREGMEATEVKVGFYEGGAVEAGPYVDHRTRVKAADSVAKLKGLFTERIEHLGAVPVVDKAGEKLKRLTDAELDQMEALLEKISADPGAGSQGEGEAPSP